MHPKAKDISDKVIQLKKDDPNIDIEKQHEHLNNLVLDEKLGNIEAKQLIRDCLQLMLNYETAVLEKLKNTFDTHELN